MARLRDKYHEKIVPAMLSEFKYKNVMQVPRMKKIVVNMGLGEAIQNAKLLDAASNEIRMLAAQKPVITRAKRSIATYKLRTGMPIGCMVTLRQERMWEFLDRLMNVAMPRIRDFKGVSRKSFDGKGNYSLGIREQIIFPEVSYDDIEKIMGLNVTIVTSAPTDEEAFGLLKKLGMPFRK